MKRILLSIFLFIPLINVTAEQSLKQVKIGVATVLTGDLSVIGKNVVNTIETYNKHFARHKLNFIVEEAKLSSIDGLTAYQKLISKNAVDVIIGGCTSNGTIAASALINNSKTPTVTIVTGGNNVDKAGPFIFRIGNSDTLNGIQEADYFIENGISEVALLTEETEYTQDIAIAFRKRFKEKGIDLIYDQNFMPGTTDFRSYATTIKHKTPKAIFMPTQTGTALGVFVKQWAEIGGDEKTPIHTTFVAAPNPDAREIGGDRMIGVMYMAPKYDPNNERSKRFFELYKSDHNIDSLIPFHTAGTVDTLDLIQTFMDKNEKFDKEKFANFLLSDVKDYKGLMGTYSFDKEGNTNLGFELARIDK